MNVWVVVLDLGANGSEAVAVFDFEPTTEEVTAAIDSPTGVFVHDGWEVFALQMTSRPEEPVERDPRAKAVLGP